MGTVLYSVTMSLDGFIVGVGGDRQWLSPYVGPNPEVECLQRNIGVLFIGKRTFLGDGTRLFDHPGGTRRSTVMP